MPEHDARRQEIDRLRRRAERHRRVALDLASMDDAWLAQDEASAIDREADKLEADMFKSEGVNVLRFMRRP